MERALDPRLLATALGGRAGLPSPDELAQLLAQTELQLLAGGGEIEDRLIATGWYLHAVASSEWATGTFGAEHRQSAFKVAAHALDLALQSRKMEPLERLRTCFAAQVAYVRGGLDPNAIAVYRRDGQGSLDRLTIDRDTHAVALACGAALLGMDLGAVFRDAREVIEQSRRLATTWEVGSITNTLFGAAALVAYGTVDLAVFLTYGNASRLEAARAAFRRAVGSDAAAADHTARWVAAHLLAIADHLRDASIWTVLPPEVPVEVRRAFTAAHPRVVSLWPPQAGFFPRTGADLRTPLDPSVRRLFLATPTSGGKTLLAQLLVAAHISRRESSVCYVAPTRSLCHEVRSDLERRLRVMRTPIDADLPAWMPPDTQANQAAVEVMTPERLSHLLRSDPSSVLTRFGLFIFDEVHNVGESGRGWTLESSLSYLHHATQGSSHRLVLISAVAGNQAHFVEWLGGDSAPEVLHRHSNWRAPRRLHALWTTRAVWEDRTSVPPTHPRAYPRVSFPIKGRLHVRVSGTQAIEHLEFSEPVGAYVQKQLPDGGSSKDAASTPAYRSLVPLIRHLAGSGPTLVIESTRAAATRLARAIAEGTGASAFPAAPQTLIDLVEGRLGAEHPLAFALRGGAAFHHGSLPAEVRTGIEEAVAEGSLLCLVATTTMTEGVNLPVRSVVIASQGTYGDGGYHEYITGSKLINAIGRAGRAARETEGVVVLARPAAFVARDFERLDPDVTDTTVLSTLATQEALEELAEFEQLLREGSDAVFLASGVALNRFLAFVWFVASRQEELEGAATRAELESALSRTLGWVQLDDEGKARWRSAAEVAFRRYEETNPTSRRKWARAGTSLSSAQALEAIAREVATTMVTDGTPIGAAATIKRILAGGRLERLLTLKEAPRSRVFTARGGGRVELSIDHRSILENWLSGTELKDLANAHFAAVREVDFRFEQLSDYLNEYFEIFLPWVLSTVITWVNQDRADEMDALPLGSDTPAYVRWGVDSAIALQLMNEGVRSRVLARAVALAYPVDAASGDVRGWLGTLGVGAWQREFNASVGDLRNLLEYAKPRGAGLLADLLEGQKVSVPIYLVADLKEGTRAEIRIAGTSFLDPIDVYVGEAKVGSISSRDQADMHTVMGATLPIEAYVIPSAEGAFLEIVPLLDGFDVQPSL